MSLRASEKFLMNPDGLSDLELGLGKGHLCPQIGFLNWSCTIPGNMLDICAVSIFYLSS